MSHKQHAATWLAFSAGMFAEAMVNASKFTDEQITADDAQNEFLMGCGEAFEALDLTADDALKSFDAGRKTAAELRETGLQKAGLAIVEDCPPLLYTGAERQLTGKPDRRLS